MSEPVIEIEGLSLCYRLAKQRVGSFKEYFIHLVRGSLSYQDLWALKDIDLTIERGEVVGIVGRNGAGKSTLSKVISGILLPTRGTLKVRGKISPILELGTGFDWELTGFENVYLNALLRGHRRREVDEKFDDIVEFSGVRRFIHSPVRNYSTGMMARLGFSIATAWVPEVLVLDEVLAVGDVRFLGRCHQRLRELRAAGTTILIVSHSPSEIIENCSRCLWLDEGLLKADGDPKGILGHYVDELQDDPPEAGAPAAGAPGAGEPAVVGAAASEA
jgi:ABC-type polysaccharide/polyol phosphate transport system ATPase subunit